MNTKQITVGQFTVEVVRKDIKNLRLGVYPPAGNLKMSVPLSMKEDTVRLFIMAKTAWIIKQQANPKVTLRHNTHLDLYVPHNSQLEKREQVLIAWYRQALKAKIPELIHKWQPIIGVTVRDWGVKRMKTKWGTCNINAARIWLNLELIKKPEHCLEYVVVHEMVHLLERHHNARFTAYMDQFLPHWRSHKHELNQIVLNHTDWNY
ncbi:MAG: M48 family metallopeptidase [Methylococcaceae bacterium]|nr:M48 family metallopeptidase [Methylococcaceae bacterium]